MVNVANHGKGRLLTLSEVSFGDGNFAMSAVSELYPSVTASKIGADKFFAMFDIFRDDKICSLEKWKGNRNTL
jgi:hypothetical protein